MQAALIAVFGQFVIHMLGALVTEKYVAALFFYIADWLVKRSDNSLDDDAVSALKKAYYSEQGSQAPAPVVDAVITPVVKP